MPVSDRLDDRARKNVERVEAEQGLSRLQELVGTKIRDTRINHGQIDVTCDGDDLVEVMTALRDGEGLRCRFFTFLSAVDRTEVADAPGGLEVLVHVYSPEHVLHANVHVPVSLESSQCPTLTGVYAGAIWHERETAEMFGIDFPGHPRLVRLYLPEDFEGTPLRRSFRLPTRSIKEWPGAKDPEEAAAAGR